MNFTQWKTNRMSFHPLHSMELLESYCLPKAYFKTLKAVSDILMNIIYDINNVVTYVKKAQVVERHVKDVVLTL